MADITWELARIRGATYGEEVRSSICEALRKINDDSGGESGSTSLFYGLGTNVINGLVSNVRTGIVEEE